MSELRETCFKICWWLKIMFQGTLFLALLKLEFNLSGLFFAFLFCVQLCDCFCCFLAIYFLFISLCFNNILSSYHQVKRIPEASRHEPSWHETIQMLSLPNVLQNCHCSQTPSRHSHWHKTILMQILWKGIQIGKFKDYLTSDWGSFLVSNP